MAVEREIIERIGRLNASQRQRVLDFARGLEDSPQGKIYSARELTKLAPEQHRRIVAEALELGADEDFEVFEAYIDPHA